MSSVGKHKITFESDFELGQEVWVALNNAYKKSPCKLCSGIGKVSVREDGEVRGLYRQTLTVGLAHFDSFYSCS